MNMGSFRGNQYFLRYVQLGPNQLGVECVEHGVPGSTPGREELPEAAFSAEELAQCHAFFTLVETKYQAVRETKEAELKLSGLDVPRAEVHKLVAQADEAKAAKKAADDAQALVEAETIVKQAEQAQLAEDLATMRAAAETEVAAKQAQLADLDAQIAAKRAELEAVPAEGAVDAQSAAESK